MTRYVTIETKSGQEIEFEVECVYNPAFSGGGCSELGYESRGDDYTVENVYRNGVEVTDRLKKFCKGLVERIDEIINES